MNFLDFAIEGPRLIEPRRHGDDRGYFAETFRADRFADEVSEAGFNPPACKLSLRRNIAFTRAINS